MDRFTSPNLEPTETLREIVARDQHGSQNDVAAVHPGGLMPTLLSDLQYFALQFTYRHPSTLFSSLIKPSPQRMIRRVTSKF